MPKILITDSYGLGYTVGKEYEVTEAVAADLIKSGKAVAVHSELPQKAVETKTKLEKR